MFAINMALGLISDANFYKKYVPEFTSLFALLKAGRKYYNKIKPDDEEFEIKIKCKINNKILNKLFSNKSINDFEFIKEIKMYDKFLL